MAEGSGKENGEGGRTFGLLTAVFGKVTSVLYLITGTVLILMALFALWVALRGSVAAFVSGSNQTGTMLTSIGLVVLALAVFDVGKYLIEEEVLRNRELRKTGEARQSLTKFLTILIIALGLEALVYVFKVGRTAGDDGGAGKSGMDQLIYPSLLIVAVALLLVAMGWYQRHSVQVEASEKKGLSAPDEVDSTGDGS